MHMMTSERLEFFTMETNNATNHKLVSSSETLDTIHMKDPFRLSQKPKIITYNTLWQEVQRDPIIRVFSAFYDDRPALDKPVVRIVSVSEETSAWPLAMQCLLWYKDSRLPKQTKLTVRIIGSPHGVDEKLFAPYLFTCDNEIPGLKPAYVSVVNASVDIKRDQISNYVRVQLPKRTKRKLEFGMCVSVAYWKQNPYRLVEWLELHKLWGVQEVTVYNSSLNAEALNVLKHYTMEGFVDLRGMPIAVMEDGEGSFLLNMSPSLNDCMYSNLYRYKRIVVTDFDEMIVPAMHSNYSELLAAIDEAEGPDHPAPSYMFRNAYYFLDFGDVNPDPWYLTTTRYLRRIATSPYGYSVKSITDSRICITLQNHLCWSRIKMYDRADWFVDVAPVFAKNHHYKRCHFDKYLQKPGTCLRLMRSYQTDDTILRFQNDLDRNVRRKLQKIGLSLKNENVYNL